MLIQLQNLNNFIPRGILNNVLSWRDGVICKTVNPDNFSLTVRKKKSKRAFRFTYVKPLSSFDAPFMSLTSDGDKIVKSSEFDTCSTLSGQQTLKSSYYLYIPVYYSLRGLGRGFRKTGNGVTMYNLKISYNGIYFSDPELVNASLPVDTSTVFLLDSVHEDQYDLLGIMISNYLNFENDPEDDKFVETTLPLAYIEMMLRERTTKVFITSSTWRKMEKSERVKSLYSEVVERAHSIKNALR